MVPIISISFFKMAVKVRIVVVVVFMFFGEKLFNTKYAETN